MRFFRSDYFDDPIASGTGGGNTLTKSGTGFVQFMGENFLNGNATHSNAGGAVTVNAGAFRLAGADATFTAYGAGSAFTLVKGATLAGSGTITLETGGPFTLSGVLSPDAFIYSPSSDLGGDNTKTQTGNAIGTLTLVGAATFATGSILEVDINTAASQTNDRVDITGAAEYQTGNVVSVQTWTAGDYTILTATGGIAAAEAGTNLGADIQYQGKDLGLRQEASLALLDSNTMVLTVGTKGGNLNLVWTGEQDNVWDSATENWEPVGEFKTFADHDAVVFGADASRKDVFVDGDKIVAGMVVTEGGYTFSGGDIVGTTQSVSGDTVKPTGKLELKAATGSVTTFTNRLDFENGIEIAAGNTLALDYDQDATDQNDISGDGALAKQGAGVLILTGDNSHKETNVQEGTLILGSDTAAQNSAVTVMADAALAAGQDAGVQSLVFQDDARLLVDTAADVLITATDTVTFADNTVVDVSQFTRGSYDLLVAGDRFIDFDPDVFTTLADGEELGGRDRAEYSLSDDTLTMTLYSDRYLLTWNGGDGKWSDRNWSGADDNTFFDGDAVLFASGAGVVTVDAAEVLVAGMEVSGGDYLFAGGAIRSTDDTDIEDRFKTEKLVVSGGTAAFLNNLDFANGIEVRGGALYGGATMAGGVTVGPDAAFGAVPDTTLAVDTLGMDAGAVFVVLSGTSLVEVTGTAALNPETKFDFSATDLRPYLLDATLSQTILTAADITGFGASRRILNYALSDLYLDQNGDELRLQAERTHNLTDAVFNLTRNQNAVAQVLEKWTSSPLYDAFLLVEDRADINVALDSLSGEPHATTQSLLASFASGFWEVRNGLPDTLREEYASAVASGSGYASLARDCGRRGPLLWFQGGGLTERSSRGSDVARGKHYGSEFSVGGEMDLGSWALGLAFRYADTRLKVDDRHSRSDLDNYQLGVYAVKGFRLGCGQLRTTFGLAGGYHDIEARRNAWIGNAFQERLRSDYHAWSLDALAEAEYRLELSSVHSLAPYVAANWDSVWTKSFREHGGSAALDGDARHQGNLSTTLGLRYGVRLGKRVRADLDLGWRHTYGNLRPSAGLRFAGDPSRNSFTAIGAALARDEFVLGAGLSVDLTDRVFLRLDYDLNAGDRTLGHRGTVTIGVGF